MLATQRGYGAQKGGWEFPGGKLEPGETPRQALARELREELGIEAEVGDYLLTVEYDYPEFHLHMDCYLAAVAAGKLTLREHSACRWLHRQELDALPWLPADLQLVAYLQAHFPGRGHRSAAGGILPCVSVETMRESDRITIESGTPGRVLMYRAALGVFRAADWSGRTAIAVGGGNNGGDGYALACLLAEHGYRCCVIRLSQKLTPDSALFAEKAVELGVAAEDYSPGCLSGYDTVVDCLLGTGFRGELRQPWLQAVTEINHSSARVISVDINSGIHGDTGQGALAVRSDLTVTIGLLKRGLLTDAAGKHMKRLVVADIGIPPCRQEWVVCTGPAAMAASGENSLPCPAWLDPVPIDVGSETKEEWL